MRVLLCINGVFYVGDVELCILFVDFICECGLIGMKFGCE